MKVLILGFDNIQEIDDVMKKLIAESRCYLFNVVCGSQYCTTYDWAIMRGAPVILIRSKGPLDLVQEADYLVMKLDASSPQWMKNLIMAWKKEGKHGTVIR